MYGPVWRSLGYSFRFYYNFVSPFYCSTQRHLLLDGPNQIPPTYHAITIRQPIDSSTMIKTCAMLGYGHVIRVGLIRSKTYEIHFKGCVFLYRNLYMRF